MDQLERQLSSHLKQQARAKSEQIGTRKTGDIQYIYEKLEDNLDYNALKQRVDILKEKLGGPSFAMAGSQNEKGLIYVIYATDELMKHGITANGLHEVVKPILRASGGGSGRMVQAGGGDPEKWQEALKEIEKFIAEKRKPL